MCSSVPDRARFGCSADRLGVSGAWSAISFGLEEILYSAVGSRWAWLHSSPSIAFMALQAAAISPSGLEAGQIASAVGRLKAAVLTVSPPRFLQSACLSRTVLLPLAAGLRTFHEARRGTGICHRRDVRVVHLVLGAEVMVRAVLEPLFLKPSAGGAGRAIGLDGALSSRCSVAFFRRLKAQLRGILPAGSIRD